MAGTEDSSKDSLLSNFKAAVSFRSHEKIVRYGTKLLTREYELKKAGKKDLGEERWSILERVLIESGPYRLRAWMLYCFSELRRQFPQSLRVKRLAAYINESLGFPQEAFDRYISLGTEYPDDVLVRKRLISSLKCCGRLTEAIEYLNKHLAEFAMDQAAWLELAEIYVAEGGLSQALFCYEELILQDPHNFCHIVSYAELLASVGDFSTSTNYYAMALALQPNCVRALWGLLRTSSMQGSKDLKKTALEGSSTKRDDLIHVAAKRLKHIYESLERNEESNEWISLCLVMIDEYLE